MAERGRRQPVQTSAMQSAHPADPAASRGWGVPVQAEPSERADRLIAVIQRDGELETTLLRRGRSLICRVRGLHGAARDHLDEIGDLLLDLSMAGVRAAPRVLAAAPGELELEGAAPLRRSPGTHRAEAAGHPPAAPEREARAGAREDLDLLLDALHDRGWVLGLTSHEGLALRGDGRVMVLDLSGLHRSPEADERLRDQRWIDAVLEDQGRTLRRRINGPFGGTGDSGSALRAPLLPARELAHQGFVDSRPTLLRPLAVTAVEGYDEGRAPFPSRRRRDPAGATGWVPGGAAGRGRRGWSAVLPRAGAAAAAAAAALLVGAGAILLLDGGGGAAAKDAAASPVSSAPGPPPAIAPGGASGVASGDADGGADGVDQSTAAASALPDPRDGLQELVAQRHAYLTSRSSASPNVPGAPADLADARRRALFEDAAITAPEPRVVSAELTSLDAQSGTAEVLAVLDVAPGQARFEDGTVTALPAEETQIRFRLQALEGRWLILEAEPVSDSSSAP